MKKRYKILLGIVIVVIIGYAIPNDIKMPVKNATKSDYHPESFWFYPWGKSVTHKGVDIFAKTGTDINSSSKGMVLYTGQISMGGNVVLVIGSQWQLHYYAHLNMIDTSSLSFVDQNSKIGTVGTSGNATGKSPHLHYSIMNIIPKPWKWDNAPQGWRKMFYENPIPYFEDVK